MDPVLSGTERPRAGTGVVIYRPYKARKNCLWDAVLRTASITVVTQAGRPMTGSIAGPARPANPREDVQRQLSGSACGSGKGAAVATFGIDGMPVVVARHAEGELELTVETTRAHSAALCLL